MKSLLVINPNTTASMTDSVVAQLAMLAPDLRIRGVTASSGVPVIADRVSFVVGAYEGLETWRKTYDGEDAVLLACFGDPGLAALRELSPVPVAGMLTSTVMVAKQRNRPFRIATAGTSWEPMLREAVTCLGALDLLMGIDVLPGTGLSVAREPERILAALQRLVDSASQAGHGLVLGGAGFAGFASQPRHLEWVIDPLAASLTVLQAHH